MFNDSSNSSSVSIMRRLVVAESVAILQSVSNMVDQLRRNESDTNLLRVFSGHDVTLRPLLFALGIAHREPPPYTSRLVFEKVDYLLQNKLQSEACYQFGDFFKDYCFEFVKLDREFCETSVTRMAGHLHWRSSS
ncbi:unnamed protein product [Anisakis simplex]|uniref:Acid phosphatase-like protein 2 (inferred by orthology to a human protein) n=1 Tax=Anisakis simplex TaxID=6269 RepID=A0A0M3KC34_ANISI|nr:unnamed protein product [Anisakis simplex]